MSDRIEAEDLDLGVWIEGTVFYDPDVERYVVSGTTSEGKAAFLDPHQALKKYNGQQVRMIITPFSTIAKLTELVEKGEMTVAQASYKPPVDS